MLESFLVTVPDREMRDRSPVIFLGQELDGYFELLVTAVETTDSGIAVLSRDVGDSDIAGRFLAVRHNCETVPDF